jgi:hypothetical protein
MSRVQEMKKDGATGEGESNPAWQGTREEEPHAPRNIQLFDF